MPRKSSQSGGPSKGTRFGSKGRQRSGSKAASETGRRRKTESQRSNGKSGSRSRRPVGGARPAAGSHGPRVLNPLPRRSEIRLQRYLAIAGVDSRRNCEEYIRDGRITIAGEPVTNPATLVSADASDIAFDGEAIRPKRFRYYVLNKPRGYLCTNRDPNARRRAVDLVPHTDDRMFTVGRLDENSEGLLLITNDGDLAHRLAHPSFQVVRIYRVHVAGVPKRETLHQLKDGIYFDGGKFRLREARVVQRRGRSSIMELELSEGRNREVRRMMARVGHKVMSLERIVFGPLRLGRLASGECRMLKPNEVRELMEFAESREARPKSKPPESDSREGLSADKNLKEKGQDKGKGKERGKDAKPRSAAGHRTRSPHRLNAAQ